MDPISLTSIAVSSMSLAANAIRPRVLQRLGSCPDTSLHVLRTCLLPKLDIVCIPDLNEDPLHEWTKKTDSGQINWLTDLLPRSFPDARIMLFEYSPRNRTPEGFTRQTMFAQAYELMDHLWTRRRGLAVRRPIVFLAHNSGAIIARSALIQSSAAITDRDAHLKSLYLSTGAIFVLDAHEDLSASWQRVLEKAMAKMPYPMINDEASNSRSTAWFEWQQDRYRAIASTIITTTVVVKNSPRTRSETGQKLLDAAEAYKTKQCLGDPARIETINRHGTDTMKYDSVEDPTYKAFVRHLRDSAEVGMSSTKAKWDLSDLRKSLSTSQNESWVKEAEKEYISQLEQTRLVEDEWTAACETFDTPGATQDEPRSNQWVPRRSRTPFDEQTYEPSNPRTLTAPGSNQNARLEDTLLHIEDVYGFLHARTLSCLDLLATRFVNLEMFDTAESIMQRLLVSWDYIFGLGSSRTLYAIQRVATIKIKQRRYADASLYLSKAVAVQFSLLKELDHRMSSEAVTEGDGHLKATRELAKRREKAQEAVDRSQIDLAVTYDMQERFGESDLIYTQVLRSRKDPMDDCYLLCLENQALHWRKRGNLSEAVGAYRTVLATYDKRKHAVTRRQRKAIEDKLNEASEALSKRRASNSFF